MNVQSLRDSLPFTSNCLYLNAGFACSPPLPVLERITTTLEQEASVGPGSPAGLILAKDIDENARNVIANFVGANPDDIQITHSSREGISIILYGIRWRPGDNLLLCDLEHPSLSTPAEVLAWRMGVKVVKPKFDSQATHSEILQAIEASMSRNTRLIALSHIQYGGGLLMPVQEIAGVARERDILFFVDGAQSVGQIAVNVGELSCDFYALSGQKWLMGPVGTGALYVRPESQDKLEPLFTTHEIEARYQSPYPPLSHFALTSHNTGLVAGLAEAVRLQDEIGVDRIEGRIRGLAALLRRRLETLPVRVLSATSPSSSAGIVTISVSDWPSRALVTELRTRFKIVARGVNAPEGVRFCTAYFNTEEEIEQVVSGLDELVAEGYSSRE